MKISTKSFLILFSILSQHGAFATKTDAFKTKNTSSYTNSPLSPLVKLTTNLYSVPGNPMSLSDGNTVVFSNAYSNAVDGDDATKLSNPGENFGVKRDGIALSIEAHQPVMVTDTIFFDMWHIKQQQYQLEFIPENLNTSGLAAYLEDTYLGTSAALSLTTSTDVLFTVTSDPASSIAGRFQVVFINSTNPLPVTFTNVAAIDLNNTVQVNWRVASETNITEYSIEHSTDGFTFSNAKTIAPELNNGQAASYNWIDANAVTGANYYRVKSVAQSGKIAYSSIVQQTIKNAKSSISIYPNPVTGGQVNLILTNQLPGLYQITILSVSGQQLFTTSFTHTANNTEHIKVPALLSGAYKLEAVAPNGAVTTTAILIKR